MKKEERLITSSAIASRTIARRVAGFISKFASESVPLSNVPADVEDVCAPRFYQLAAKGYHISCARDWGMCECILPLEGSETFVGIPLANIEGDTLVQKENNLRCLDVEAFQKTLDQDGFSFQATPGSLYIIPGRFACVRLCSSEAAAHGLCWMQFGDVKTCYYAIEHTKRLKAEGCFPADCPQAIQQPSLLGYFEQALQSM